MTKQVVVIGTAVMTTLLALVVLWQFRIVVIYVLISLALAATVRPILTPGCKTQLRYTHAPDFALRGQPRYLRSVTLPVGRLLIGDSRIGPNDSGAE